MPTIANLFKSNLENFDQKADPYIDYYSLLFKTYLQKGKIYPGRLNPKKILEAGDVNITTPVLEFCVEAFRSESARAKLLALGLFNDFIRWGDIEAAHIINCTDLFDKILLEIANTETGSVHLGRGKSLFAGLESSEQLKQELYV